MAIFDEAPKQPARTDQLGQDLSLLSVDDLGERIPALKAEIVRLEADMKAKGASRLAAESLFRRS